MTDEQWQNLSDQVCSTLEEILTSTYVYERHARERGITLPQLTAATVMHLVRTTVEASGEQDGGSWEDYHSRYGKSN